MLKVTNLHKSFGDLQVLKGVNLSVKKGEVVAIIGPSGSGKSTFLRCLNALEKPHLGEVIVEGEPFFSCLEEGKEVSVSNKQKHKLLAKMGMVFQHFHLFPHKTVLENVTEAPVTVKKMKKSVAKDMAMELLKKVVMYSNLIWIFTALIACHLPNMKFLRLILHDLVEKLLQIFIQKMMLIDMFPNLVSSQQFIHQ